MTPAEIHQANRIIALFLRENPQFISDFFVRDDRLETNSVEASREYFLWCASKGYCTFEEALTNNLEIAKLAREAGVKG